MLSPSCLVRQCALLAVLSSVAFAQAGAGAAVETGQEQSTEAAKVASEPAKSDEQENEKEKDAAQDLAETLRESEVGPVSRVMGFRIVQSAVKTYMHGTAVADWRWKGGTRGFPNTFDVRESHFYLGAHVLDIIQPEIFLQYEKRTQDQIPIEVRYAQIDFKVFGELAVLRTGLFLIPFGVLNTDLFPRYAVKFTERPEVHLRVVPIQWSETGVQLRGRWEWAPGRALTYQAYVTNGQVSTVVGGRATYDEAVRSLTGAKTYGARVSLEPLDGLAIGLSGYHGAVDGVDGGLVVAGLDGVYRNGPFSADGEYILGYRLDPATGAQVPVDGWYVEAGYRVLPFLEPAVSMGGMLASPAPIDSLLELWAGLTFYPLPDQFPTTMFRVNYGHKLYGDSTTSDEVTTAFLLGF